MADAPPLSGALSARVTLLLGVVAVGLPFVISALLPHVPASGAPLELLDLAARYPASELTFDRRPIGTQEDFRPRITNVNIVDLDQDGFPDILACDAVRHTIWWHRHAGSGAWEDRTLCPTNSIAAPAHTTVVDLDQDGDVDILVAGLRSEWPTDERVGQVILLENTGDLTFEVKILLDDVRRVTDVQAGDLDADGDLDLVVAEFGYLHGRILWMENLGEGRFVDRELAMAPGTIHVPLADYDQDGDLDIAATVTQNEEEVWILENTGAETFSPIPHRVWYTPNFDIGGAGMIQTDLDRDGDQDLILSVGDNLELVYPCPQPYHGAVWLENRGDLEFEAHRISNLAGTYAADVADLDGDGDTDVVLASMFNEWKQPGSASLVWLENDGTQNFTTWQIDEAPSHLCTVACGDLNGDDRPDIVAGSLLTFEPFERAGRVTAWLNQDVRQK